MSDTTTGADEYPLTPMQEGMLFHHLADPTSGVDLEQIVCTLRHPVDVASLEQAWRDAAAHHERLRTVFRWRGVPSPRQRTLPAVDLPLRVHDLRGNAQREAEDRFDRFLADDRARGFGLTRPPLVRLDLFTFGPQEHRLVWSFPHILLDGKSFPMVLRDVFRLYDARTAGTAYEPARRPPYRDFVEWYAGRDVERAEAFWRRYLEGFASPTPIGAAGRSTGGSGSRGAVGERREIVARLSVEASSSLRRLAEDRFIRTSTVVHGAWGLLLSRLSGMSDVVFGATRACRATACSGAEEMVGVLINTLPVRVDTHADDSVREWLRRLRRDQLEVRDFEHTPLVRIRQWCGVPAGLPLFHSLVIYDHASLDGVLQQEGGGGGGTASSGSWSAPAIRSRCTPTGRIASS